MSNGDITLNKYEVALRCIAYSEVSNVECLREFALAALQAKSFADTLLILIDGQDDA